MKSKEDLPIRKMKKVRFQIQEEMDQLDASLTEVLKWSARIKHNDVKKSRRQLFRPQISRPLSPREDPEGAGIKGSIFLKNRHFIIQERFNKSIYDGINANYKMWHMTACKISFSLSFLK